MGKRNKVTTRDLAEYTGISQSAVSMILSGRPGVSFTEDTVRKVKEAAAELGYQKPRKKEAPKEKVLRNVIVVLGPSLSNGYYSMMVHSITKHAAEYGYQVLTAITFRSAEAEDRYFELLNRAELAGIIALYPLSNTSPANRLAKEIPVISIGEKQEGIRYDSVELDSRKTGFLVGEYLLSLGHRKVLYLSPPVLKKEISRINRLEGVRDAFREQGLDPSMVRLVSPTSTAYALYPADEAEYRNGYDLTVKTIQDKTEATALIGHNDMSALGILAALTDLKCRVPRDYSVVGFDNILHASMPQIGLTTVEHSSVLKGQAAVEMIYRKNQRREKQTAGKYTMRAEYEPHLIVRGSSGPAPV